MDRPFAHYGAIPLDTDFLKAGRYAMIGLGKLAEAVLGPGTWVHGLDCTPTLTPGLSVLVGQGEIYAVGNVDDTDMGRLVADTTNQIVKQGLVMGNTSLTAFSAPGSSGQARNYLVQARYVDADTNAVVLPYYNAADPGSPLSGPNNSGSASATARQGVCVVSLKAGTAATAGSQATPTPDAGNVPLWVVTLVYGQTAIAAGDISRHPDAPYISGLKDSGGFAIAGKVGKLDTDIQNVSNGVPLLVTFGNTQYGARYWSGADKAFVAPVDGVYAISANVIWQNPNTSSTCWLEVYVNGTVDSRGVEVQGKGVNLSTPIATDLLLSAGDKVSIKANITGDSEPIGINHDADRYSYFTFRFAAYPPA
ncbi:hypothetical protein SAMN02949497_3405 [Methylomagnum ishizawai]|uniref:C1q domain-containing protein n=1 Tax=Methylomagnum ishizawai TaxID=1760988 RepID=A0A1Y6D885_9GAMM|nr:hypothetical protein [Methylomagnum ishizawai]SMF96025.1 hypothetical protein SAMN02949497_3405 [Methylomagnum ishizawai]